MKAIRNNWKYFFSVLFGALMVALCWGFFDGNNEETPHSDRVEKQVQRANDSLKQVNSVLSERFYDLQARFDTAIKAAAKTRVEIIYQDKKQNETIRIIRSYNANQLLQYWATIKPDTAYSGKRY